RRKGVGADYSVHIYAVAAVLTPAELAQCTTTQVREPVASKQGAAPPTTSTSTSSTPASGPLPRSESASSSMSPAKRFSTTAWIARTSSPGSRFAVTGSKTSVASSTVKRVQPAL